MNCACPVCGGTLDFADVRFEPESGLVIGGGRFAALTKQEAALFELLWDRPGRTLTKVQLLDNAYQLFAGDGPTEKIIDVFICKIRKKLDGLGISIATDWGRGYRLQKGVTHEQ